MVGRRNDYLGLVLGWALLVVGLWFCVISRGFCVLSWFEMCFGECARVGVEKEGNGWERFDLVLCRTDSMSKNLKEMVLILVMLWSSPFTVWGSNSKRKTFSPWKMDRPKWLCGGFCFTVFWVWFLLFSRLPNGLSCVLSLGSWAKLMKINFFYIGFKSWRLRLKLAKLLSWALLSGFTFFFISQPVGNERVDVLLRELRKREESRNARS